LEESLPEDKVKEVMDNCGLSRLDWCLATLIYLELTSSNQLSPSKRNVEAKPLTLMKASIFGKTRGGSAPRKFEEAITLDSLGLALVGGLITLVSSFNKADTRFELYVIPDSSPISLEHSKIAYSYLHGVTSGGETLNEVIRRFVGFEGGLSVDNAIMMSFLVFLLDVLEKPA